MNIINKLQRGEAKLVKKEELEKCSKEEEKTFLFYYLTG